MSTTSAPQTPARRADAAEQPGYYRSLFAVVLLFLEGTLSIIYGIAAIGNSSYFAHSTHYIFGNLKTWGWVTLILGVLALAACGSLVRGHRFGRYFGMAVGTFAALGALLDIPAAPFWSLAVFAMSIWIVAGLAVYSGAGAQDDDLPSPSSGRPLGPRPIT